MTDEQYIFGSILALANKFQIVGNQTTEELTLKQWFMLMMISKISSEHPSMTDVANFTGSTRQNVTKMLLILEKKGFVALNNLPQDQKSVRVYLTNKSKDYFEKVSEPGNALLNEIFKNIDEEKLKCVSEVFSNLFDNIDEILKNNNKNLVSPTEAKGRLLWQ